MLLSLLLLTAWGRAFADSVTLTTWYPAPYGIYSQLRSTGNSYFAYQGGNVGIGTTSPQFPLDVQGSPGADGLSYFRAKGGDTQVNLAIDSGNTAAANAAILFKDRGANKWQLGKESTNNRFFLWDMSSGSYALIVNPGGDVGVGTTNPGAKLDVNGTVRMTGFSMPNGASNGYVLKSDGSGNGAWQPSGGLTCTTRTASQNSPPNYAYNIASCQGGEKVFGGGCTVNGDCGDARVFGSYPNSPTSWACATAGCATSKTAWAICCQ